MPKTRDVIDALVFLPGLGFLGVVVFVLMTGIATLGWYVFLGWMWVLTIWLPLPRSVGGAIAVMASALTVYAVVRRLIEGPRLARQA